MIPYDPEIFLFDIYPPNMKILTCKAICTLMLIIAVFTVANTWKWPKCLSNDE